MKILGGVVESIIYRRGLPCMILSAGEGVFNKFKVYLNPRIKPKLMNPVGKKIILVEGHFLPQDESIFSPELIVEEDENGSTEEHRLRFD